MKTRPIALTVCLVLAVGPLTPEAVSAGSGEHRPRGGVVVGPRTAGPVLTQPAFPRHGVRPHPVRPFVSLGVVTTPVVVYNPPAVVYVSPPPVYVAPPAALTLAPTPPPMPRVIEYPTGRYELRGDGVTVPYLWVWIPNPPLEPPAPAEPASPPSPTQPPQHAPQAPHSEIYHWTDERGVTTWTDQWHKIPEGYRPQRNPW